MCPRQVSEVSVDDVHRAVHEITQQAHLLAVRDSAPQERLLLVALCNEIHLGGKVSFARAPLFFFVLQYLGLASPAAAVATAAAVVIVQTPEHRLLLLLYHSVAASFPPCPASRVKKINTLRKCFEARSPRAPSVLQYSIPLLGGTNYLKIELGLC